MITIRRADERGRTAIEWLDSWHTFSFGDYYDPGQMGFGPLRVINDDRVLPNAGFPMHPHRDMEIITYVLKGALEHRDSLGTGSVIKPGDVQRMSAGTGIRHSEFNPSKTEGVHLLQIWILPDTKNLSPSYEQRNFSDEEKQGKLRLIASPDGRDGSVTIRQDVNLFAAMLRPGDEVNLQLSTGRKAWFQLAEGEVMLNGKRLFAGDGAAVTNEQTLSLKGEEEADILLFDLPSTL